MRPLSFFLLITATALWAESPLLQTGQTKCYDPVTHTEIACAGTGQDGDYQAGAAHDYSRDIATGVVTDYATQLQWQDSYEDGIPQIPWDDAVQFCQELTLDGGGWRMPTLAELRGLLHFGATPPLIDSNIFVNTDDGTYWSSDDPADNPATVSFSYGDINIFYTSKDVYYINIRCVRTYDGGAG